MLQDSQPWVQAEIAAASAAAVDGGPGGDPARLQRLLALNDFISYVLSRYDAFTGRTADGEHSGA